MYFISENNKKEGPYTFEELKAQRLTDDMLAWKEGMNNWCKISEIPELTELVIATPPPLPYEIQNEKAKEKKAHINEVKKKAIWNIIGASLFMGLIIGVFISWLLLGAAESTHGRELDGYYQFGFYFWGILIAEIVALIIAGIKIAMLKPDATIMNTNSGSDSKWNPPLHRRK